MAIKLIKDPIVGNITFSLIEDKILSSSLFNRLHYVLQNSCAYLVYPANKTSRFIHSLGTMKYVTDLYNYGIINVADRNILIEYFNSFFVAFCR